MGSKINRNIILRLNKYQQRILYPVLIASLIACFSTVLCLAYLYFPADHKIFQTINLKSLKIYIPVFLMCLTVFLFFLVIWTYKMSNKLVGPFERIINDLDKMISEKKKTPLTTRKGDEMFEELLKRVNTLIS